MALSTRLCRGMSGTTPHRNRRQTFAHKVASLHVQKCFLAMVLLGCCCRQSSSSTCACASPGRATSCPGVSKHVVSKSRPKPMSAVNRKILHVHSRCVRMPDERREYFCRHDYGAQAVGCHPQPEGGIFSGHAMVRRQTQQQAAANRRAVKHRKRRERRRAKLVQNMPRTTDSTRFEPPRWRLLGQFLLLVPTTGAEMRAGSLENQSASGPRGQRQRRLFGNGAQHLVGQRIERVWVVHFD